MTKIHLEKRKKAKEMYLEHSGGLSDRQIAQAVGLSRVTVGKARRGEEWAAELESINEASRKKASEAVSDDLATAHKRYLENLSSLSHRIEQTLSTSKKLTPAEISQLTKAVATMAKTAHLIHGAPTENIKQESRGAIKHTHEYNGPVAECMEKIQNGTLDETTGQNLIADLAKSIQRFRAEVNGEETDFNYKGIEG